MWSLHVLSMLCKEPQWKNMQNETNSYPAHVPGQDMRQTLEKTGSLGTLEDEMGKKADQ